MMPDLFNLTFYEIDFNWLGTSSDFLKILKKTIKELISYPISKRILVTFFYFQHIMEDIFWSGTPLLESVGEHEPHVEELRETIRNTIRKAVIPLRAYAKEYEKYQELVNMDVNQYVKYVWNIVNIIF